MIKKSNPQQNAENPPQNTDLLAVAGSRIKRVFRRIGFHFVALMSGVLVGVTVSPTTFVTIPESQPIGAITYLALVILFPRGLQPINSAFGILTSLVWCLFGPWQLAFIWGALQRFALDLIENREFFHLRRVGTLFLCLIMLIGFFELHPWSAISNFFLLLFVGITLIGVLFKHIRKLRNEREIKVVNILSQPSSNQQILDDYHQQIDNLLKLSNKLPMTQSVHIQRICEQARLILNSMDTDPRDWIPGNKFLIRYLNAVQKIVDHSQKLTSSKVDSPQAAAALLESETLLERLDYAFTQQQLRLLDNDTQDLTIELNVLDKLLKMEGYK